MIKFKTIGSDPEFGIKKGRSYLPSYMFIDGTKDEPEELENGFFLLKDNLLLEGNIPPATNKNEFIENMSFLKMITSAILAGKGAVLVEEDLIKYNSKFIESPDGQEFGCSSYRDPYKGEEVQTPELKGNNRSLGMHVHIGFEVMEGVDKDWFEFNPYIAKAWDFFATIPSDKIHYTPQRRKKYGAYGSYRHTKYGIEVRSLGGYFARDEYLGWIYDQVQKTLKFCSSQRNLLLLDQVDAPKEEYYELLGINLEEQIPVVKHLNYQNV